MKCSHQYTTLRINTDAREREADSEQVRGGEAAQFRQQVPHVIDAWLEGRRPGVERVVTAELSKPDMPIWLVAVSGHGPRWRHSPQADRRHGAGIAAALAALCSARLSVSELEITASRLTAARSRRRTAGDRQRRGRRAERREDGRRGGGRTSGSLTDDGTGG